MSHKGANGAGVGGRAEGEEEEGEVESCRDPLALAALQRCGGGTERGAATRGTGTGTWTGDGTGTKTRPGAVVHASCRGGVCVCHGVGHGVVRTSGLELLCAEADQLLDLLGLDGLAGPGVVPPGLERLLVGELVVGALLGLELAVPALEAGEEARHGGWVWGVGWQVSAGCFKDRQTRVRVGGFGMVWVDRLVGLVESGDPPVWDSTDNDAGQLAEKERVHALLGSDCRGGGNMGCGHATVREGEKEKRRRKKKKGKWFGWGGREWAGLAWAS